MTYKEFHKKVSNFLHQWNDGYGNFHEQSDIDKSFLKIYWSAGGQSGGSCWVTEKQTYYLVSGDPEPSFNILDAVLLEFASSINLMQYKGLERLIVTEPDNENSYSDYYGNYTNYYQKTISLKSIYDFLIKYELLKS